MPLQEVVKQYKFIGVILEGNIPEITRIKLRYSNDEKSSEESVINMENPIKIKYE